MDPFKTTVVFLFSIMAFMAFAVHFANRERKRKEDKKKVMDFQKLLRTLLINSGWRKNPGLTPEDTSKKVVEYLKSNHIDTEFNSLLRDVAYYSAKQYRPITDSETMKILEDTHILLLELYVEYQKTNKQPRVLREQKIDELQKEFFDRLELIVLDKIDPSDC